MLWRLEESMLWRLEAARQIKETEHERVQGKAKAHKPWQPHCLKKENERKLKGPYTTLLLHNSYSPPLWSADSRGPSPGGTVELVRYTNSFNQHTLYTNHSTKIVASNHHTLTTTNPPPAPPARPPRPSTTAPAARARRATSHPPATCTSPSPLPRTAPPSSHPRTPAETQ